MSVLVYKFCSLYDETRSSYNTRSQLSVRTYKFCVHVLNMNDYECGRNIGLQVVPHIRQSGTVCEVNY